MTSAMFGPEGLPAVIGDENTIEEIHPDFKCLFSSFYVQGQRQFLPFRSTIPSQHYTGLQNCHFHYNHPHEPRSETRTYVPHVPGKVTLGSYR